MTTVILGTMIITMLNRHISHNEILVKDIVAKEAKGHFESIVSSKYWSTNHEEVYIKVDDSLKSEVYSKSNFTYTKDGELLVEVSPNWMNQQLYELKNKTNKNYIKITSLNPLNPKNKPDVFEKEALDFLSKNKDKKYYSKISEDSSQFNFMGALTVNKSCLKCHGAQGYKEGDVKGGIRVSIPTDDYFNKLEEIQEDYNYLILVILFSAIVALSLLVWFVNKTFSNQNLIEKNYKEISSLQKSNDELLTRFEYAIDGTRDGLWDWDLKTDHVFFSKNWKMMLGYEDDEIKNELKEWERLVHPDDKEKAIQDILDNHNKITDYYQNIHRLKHKDGTWVWILDRGRTYFDEDGKAVRMVGFHSNITELKNLEIRLEEKEEEVSQLKIVIDNAPIGIIITDLETKMMYANPRYCNLAGYSKSELIGKNPCELNFNEDEIEKYKELWNISGRQEAAGGIFKNIRKDGSEYWETVTVSPILDSNGKTTYYLGIVREITKEVYLEKELKEKEELMLSQSKNAAMGEMISMIAHQWRQPITAISMNANNIMISVELDMLEKEEVRQIATNISEQTQFLSKTIDDFRNFFQKDKSIDEVYIKNIIDELSSIILASLKNSGVSFNVDFEEDLSINTYQRELLQVLLNIVKNAKEAFSEDFKGSKTINTTIKKEKEGILIIISDNAGGIDPKNLENIFDAYFTTKEEYNGTGLGLYMSKMIVEKHLKGKIEARNIDNGAQFKIYIKNLL